MIDPGPVKATRPALTSPYKKAVVSHPREPIESGQVLVRRAAGPAAAFVAVLARVVLVLSGHVALGGLATTGLTVAWRYATVRGPRGHRRWRSVTRL